MTRFDKLVRRFFHGSLCVIALATLPASAQIQEPPPPTCNFDSTVPAQVRWEGSTERLGDIVLTCTGGAPWVAGHPIGTANIIVTPSVALTNRVFPDGTADVLLLIDEPFPASPFPVNEVGSQGNSGPQKLCVADLNSNCSLTGTGGVTNPYKNTRNVFQGTIQTANGVNWVEFFGVPLDDPGAGKQRVIRIANLRCEMREAVNGGTVFAYVSISGSGAFQIPQTAVTLASVQPGVAAGPNCTYDQSSHLVGCPSSANQINVAVSEGFSSSFKTAVASSLDQTSGGTALKPARKLGGGTIEEQNIPGANYFTESGLTITAVPASYTGSGIGEASHGTWLTVTLTNIPAGVRITAPGVVAGGVNSPNLLLYRVNIPSGGWQFDPAFYATAPLDALLVDTTGASPPDSAFVVYEVVGDDPALTESINIPLAVTAAEGVSTAAISSMVTLSPTPELPVDTGAGNDWRAPSDVYPIPRFYTSLRPVLTSGLQFTGIFAPGQPLTAEYTITNPAAGTIVLTELDLWCVRSNNSIIGDDVRLNITLGPWQSYHYTNTWTFPAGANRCAVTYLANLGAEGSTIPGSFDGFLVNIPGPVSLVVNAVGGGTVSVDPSSADGTYLSGTRVCLTATPNAGWVFGFWSGATVDSSNCLTVTADTTVTANFLCTGCFSIDQPSLYFGATNSGAVVTAPQKVQVTASPGASWSVSSSKSYIVVSPTSGTGSGSFTVSIQRTTLPSPSTQQGTITVTAPAASNSPQTVQVSVKVMNDSSTGSPFGSFDTPANNTTGISGSVAVTGWALDNIGVQTVQIWRNPIGSEPTGSNGLIYIGDATFVPGARPDVQSAYPSSPLNNRAGWGYLMLTNGLPNNGSPTGLGNGTYVLHAIATSIDGKTFELGTKTINCDNGDATIPFGAIDTPGQGETVSGTIVNFGWALTPQPYSIPTDGSTITVTVDGVTLGHPVYNQYRSDIATGFPGYANANGAVGYFSIDTTTLSNGIHTIGWLVYDNNGKGAGIGSRFFWVQN